jgi:uncharacterized protein
VLFANSQLVGTFKGFNDKGLEFAAEIIAPYEASMLERPQLGQFLLIELGSEEEAALGRITRFVPSGLLATAEGEDYVNTMQKRKQQVPEDLKQQRLKYRVQVKLLGAVKVVKNQVVYIPSQRRLPHLGAKVALPSSAVLQVLCTLSEGKTDLGDYVLGEFIFCGAGQDAGVKFRCLDPKLNVTFDIGNLVSRRSVVFARAGYGKSNLIKFLVSELYREEPKTEHNLRVGTLIFDADGEYFWPDTVKKRPGLCDVPHLQDRLVVFTNRVAPSAYYGAWKVGEVKLDVRQLRARDVIGIAVSAERQTQQNVLKLKSLSDTNWLSLVDLIQTQGLQASDADVGRLLGYPANQIATSAAEIAAARSNMFGVVRALHDPNSRVLSGALEALRSGCIVVVDISLLSSAAGNMLAGLLLRRIFSHNQENFTAGSEHPIIPVIAVIEEAQSVLGRNLDETSPFVEWVKEGRKYDLGAMLVTQQPGSMAAEILSQADNWFCFHLLSEGDAGTLGKYNSHYSEDVLAHLIGEPIPGNCYMWSAPLQPFVLPVRVRSFEGLYKQNVNSDTAAQPVPNIRAQGLLRHLSEALDRLAAALIPKLKEPNVKFCAIPQQKLPAGGQPIGIKSGQLYFLIRDIKTASDTQSEEQLKRPLLTHILGEGRVHVLKHGDTEYYCADVQDWSTVLGYSPKLISI